VQKPFKDMLCKVCFNLVHYFGCISLFHTCPRRAACLAQIALEGVDSAVARHAKKPMKLSPSYHILKEVKCMGGKPAVMSVPKVAADASVAPASAPSPSAAAVPAAKAAKAPSAPAASPAPPQPPARKMLDGLEVPEISFVYRDTFDLADHTQARVATKSGRPKYIVAKIVLPQLVRGHCA
jgi:hypothetical protein